LAVAGGKPVGPGVSAKAGVGLKLTVAGNAIVLSGLTLTFSTPAVLAALASLCEVLIPIADATAPSEASVTT